MKKLVELQEILDTLTTDTKLSEIANEVGIYNIRDLAATVRVAGYEMKSKSIWLSEKQSSIRVIYVIKQ